VKRNSLIDLHTHGIGRYDTRTSKPGDVLKIAELHSKAGTTAILPTIYSGTIEQMRVNMEAVRVAMETQAQGSRVQKSNPPTPPLLKGGNVSIVTRHPVPDGTGRHSSQILGVHIEGPFLNPVRCGAQDKKSFMKPGIPYLKKLINGYEDIIKIITIAPEIPGALKVIERCASLGIKVNMGHSDATFNQALKGKHAGASGISHIFNAMRPFHHREPGLAGFGLTDDDIYIEVIADGFHLDLHTLKLIMRTKRHDRIILVSDSVKGAGSGKRSILVKPGVLAGGAVTLSDAVNNLVKAGTPRKDALKFASANPIRYLGRADLQG
jgi:N-acetylglucosamine-6-phosphate deacetylase